MDVPLTDPPTDTDWAWYVRYAIPPLGTRRQLWVSREAKERFTRRTGRADPFPQVEDFNAADAIIPRD